MASTFTTNTGIEKIGDGEQTGQWGQTTNLNFDIVDRALNGVLPIQLSSTAFTLTTSSGGLSDGQAAAVVFSGSIGGPATITIAPDTAQKTYVIRNDSNQPLTITQGSGGDVTIPVGSATVVACTGVGVTSRVFEAGISPVNLATNVTGTLPVANGGTGRSTITSGAIVLGNGTGQVGQLVGTSVGQVAQWNGSTWAVESLPAGGVTNVTASAPLASSGGSTPDISLTGTVPLNRGGTNATTAAGARTSLGLGTIATQNSNSVTITGGSISGVSGLVTATGGNQTVTGVDFLFNRSGIGSANFNGSTSPLTLTQTGTFDALAIFSNRTTSARGIDINIGQSAATPATGSFFLQGRNPQSTTRILLRTDGGIENFSANNINLSDERQKKDITPLPSEWDCIKQWGLVSFRYKDQSADEVPSYGVIAQQIEPICPELVRIFQHAAAAVVDADGNETRPAQEELLGVREPQMIWLAVKALQEAMARIETLEAQVAALQSSAV